MIVINFFARCPTEFDAPLHIAEFTYRSDSPVGVDPPVKRSSSRLVVFILQPCIHPESARPLMNVAQLVTKDIQRRQCRRIIFRIRHKEIVSIHVRITLPHHLHIIARTKVDGVFRRFVVMTLLRHKTVNSRAIILELQVFTAKCEVSRQEKAVMQIRSGHTAKPQSKTLHRVVTDHIVNRTDVKTTQFPILGSGNIACSENFRRLLQPSEKRQPT